MKRIASLHALRFFAALFIFLHHTGIFFLPGKYEWFYQTFFYNLFMGVSFFIMASGFVLSYTYAPKMEGRFGFSYLSYLKKRLGRIYPLHIATLVLALPIAGTVGYHSLPILITNIFLLQSFIPNSDYYFQFNSPSWFLSDLLIFYCLFPLFLVVNNKVSWPFHKKVAMSIAVLGIYAMLLLSATNLKINSHWFFYISPLSRGLDFGIGIFVYFLYRRLQKRPQFSLSTGTILEVAAMGLLILCLSMAYLIPLPIRYSLYFLIPVGFLLFIFSFQRGAISDFLSGNLWQYLADLSLTFLMIHWIIMKYMVRLPIVVFLPSPVLWSAIAFVLSLCLSIVAQRYFFASWKVLRNHLTKSK